ncbi:hypothetical protein [Marinobacter sp. LN3S78]|uniref:hypothetical protein n=1 Tax=Marinobacter sp. LN3S78 TaxID=3382300 RepID=UPI00387A960C
MTPELREKKKKEMLLKVNQAAQIWSAGDYEQASHLFSEFCGIAFPYQSTDSDLYWFFVQLSIVYADYITQEKTRDFKTWAIGEACKALRAAA